MATDISPELLAQIQAYYAKNGDVTPFQDPATGIYYQPSGDGSSGSEFTRYNSYAPSWGDGARHDGEFGQTYTPEGTYQGEYAWQDDDWKKSLMIALAAAGGMMFLPGGALAGGAGSGAATGMAGDAFMPGALGAGGSEVAYGSLIPGLESYALPAAVGGAAGAAGGGSLVGSSGGMAAPAASTAAFNSALGGTGAAAGGLSGLLGGAGGLSSLLGPVLGGIVGSQGTDNTSTTARDIPEWLKPSVMGLLAQTDALRNKQMAPGYLEGYEDMRNKGAGLLAQPLAGNGVGKVPYPTIFGR